MINFKNMKIDVRITLWAGLCILFVSLSIILYASNSMRREAEVYTLETVRLLASENARLVEIEIEESLVTAKTLAHTLQTQVTTNNSFTRAQVDNILKEVLINNPSIIGTYTLWEPNAFDGNDEEFINAPAHDETGRYIPYWNKDSSGNVAVEALLGYSEPGIGDYYQVPKQTKEVTVLDPYVYPIQGVDVLITSLVVPIVKNGKFYGIAGVDITLDFLQSISDSVNIYDNTGQLSLFSSNGTVSGVTGHPELVGKPLSEIYPEDTGRVETIINRGQELIDYKDRTFSVFTPIYFSEVKNPWSVNIQLEDDKVFEQFNGVIRVVVILGIMFTIIALFVVTQLSKRISKPIIHTVEYAKTVASGDLRLQIDINQKDEVGQLANALKTMITRVSEVVSTVSTMSQQIVTATSHLEKGNIDLAGRTEQQAAALEETSAAIEEMNSSIRSNADNTITANKLSVDVSQKADNGAKAVDNMISSMKEIKEFSTRISDIIEVINNIAFQTNLLALNASIEAARAGEQGKGFAVVAVEVRKLAKRSDKAAKEISDIIKTSNIKVLEGVDIANNAGMMLTEINNAVKKVTTLVAEISAASQEQLSSVNQIDQTLLTLDKNTQQNASMVDDATNETKELSEQAIELNKNIRFFKTE